MKNIIHEYLTGQTIHSAVYNRKALFLISCAVSWMLSFLITPSVAKNRKITIGLAIALNEEYVILLESLDYHAYCTFFT